MGILQWNTVNNLAKKLTLYQNKTNLQYADFQPVKFLGSDIPTADIPISLSHLESLFSNTLIYYS